jgi:pimeloyl-[acyl-carrier protein] methyl ester esterase
LTGADLMPASRLENQAGREALTLVTIPGWLGPAEVFAGLQEELPGFPLHRIELAGFGRRQEELPGEWSLDWAVGDIAAVVERLPGKELVLIGASVGGMIALACAARELPRVRAVVAIGSAAHFVPDPAFPVSAVITAARNDFHGLIQQACETLFFTDDDREAAEAAIRETAAAAATIRSPQRAVEILERIYDADIRGELSRIDVPVLLLYGEKDRVAPPEVREALRQGIPNARLETIGGAGHFPYMTNPRKTAENIRSFLSQLAPL